MSPMQDDPETETPGNLPPPATGREAVSQRLFKPVFGASAFFAILGIAATILITLFFVAI